MYKCYLKVALGYSPVVWGLLSMHKTFALVPKNHTNAHAHTDKETHTDMHRAKNMIGEQINDRQIE
jgi:hypothetical protein